MNDGMGTLFGMIKTLKQIVQLTEKRVENNANMIKTIGETVLKSMDQSIKMKEDIKILKQKLMALEASGIN